MKLAFFKRKIVRQDVVQNVRNSVLGALNEIMADMIEQGLVSENCEVLPLEAHAEVESFPKKDCVLFNSFMMEVENKVFRFGFQVGVSIFKDTNCYKHYKAISYLFDRFKPLEVFNVYKDGSEKFCEAVVTDGTILNPVLKSNVRCVQLIDVECLSDVAQ